MPRHLGYKRRDPKKLEARRFAAVARLQRGESASVIARSLGVSTESVQRWALWHRSGGDERLRLRPKTRGPRPKLPSEKLARLRELLEQGPVAHGFDTPVWTTERVTHLIWRRFRVRYSRDHVKHNLLPGLEWKRHIDRLSRQRSLGISGQNLPIPIEIDSAGEFVVSKTEEV